MERLCWSGIWYCEPANDDNLRLRYAVMYIAPVVREPVQVGEEGQGLYIRPSKSLHYDWEPHHLQIMEWSDAPDYHPGDV